jgi:predicted metalloprotease with PDZ domain
LLKQTTGMRLFLFLLCNSLAFLSFAQRKEDTQQIQPAISYRLEVDTSRHCVSVEMRLRNMVDSFHLAMFAHPEYDDRFWRYIKDLRVENGLVLREDSALWRIRKTGSETVLHYRVQWPNQQGIRPAWLPFLSLGGGLIGGPHFYLYVVGAEAAAASMQLKLPAGWQSETALQTAKDSSGFLAPNVAALVDAPILIGNFKKWSFVVDSVPHSVAYWSSAASQKFNEDSFVAGIEKIVRQTKVLFGRMPYKAYHFLLMDDAYGALEHAASVTVGAPSADLAKDVSMYFPEIAHEYFHAWNLVRIHPVAFDGKVRYQAPLLAKELWWSEGATMYYADVLLRRAGLRTPEPSRLYHLTKLLTQYYNNAGNYKRSPEDLSLAQNAPAGMLGDYSAGPHLPGELIAILLDNFIRDATSEKKSLDDVMRKMAEQFSGEKGFVSTDVERTIAEVCHRNVHSFFERYIYKAALLPFNDYLRLIGLKAKLTWKKAVGDDNKALPDLEVYAWQKPSSPRVLLGLISPLGLWGRAGIHTGDEVLAVNEQPVKTPRDFYAQVRGKAIGDSLKLAIKQKEQKKIVLLVLSGYKQAVVTVTETTATEKQKRLRNKWMRAE